MQQYYISTVGLDGVNFKKVSGTKYLFDDVEIGFYRDTSRLPYTWVGTHIPSGMATHHIGKYFKTKSECMEYVKLHIDEIKAKAKEERVLRITNMLRDYEKKNKI